MGDWPVMETGSIEFELKFTGAPAEIASLPESSFVSAVAPHGGAWERLTSTYFDTPDSALAARGLSLRLREEGAAYIQAVKQKGADPAARREYETGITDAAAFPAPCGDDAIDALIAETAEALAPVAGTMVDRWRSEVWFKGAQIELAIDHGRVESRDENGSALSGPLAEVELELLSGPRASLFEFAKLLIDNASLRSAVGSKLEKALALKNSAASIGKNNRLNIDADMTAADVLAAALGDSVARIASLQSAILDLRMAEGVHQMRVALRRLRAVERIYRRYLKSSEITTLAARAKLIASALGPARDWDVFLDETIRAAMKDGAAAQSLRALKARAEAKRAHAWMQATTVVNGRDFSHFLMDLTYAATVQSWRTEASDFMEAPVGVFAEKALNRALKNVRKTAARIGP
ncbi:MAG: CHAD domain-containing protein, partial [Pseudomonadota bacterium]